MPKAAPRSAPKAPGPLASLAVGAAVEGRYRDSWYEAAILQVADAKGNLRVKWDYDGSEGMLSASEVRIAMKGERGAPPPLDSPAQEAACPPSAAAAAAPLAARTPLAATAAPTA